jgi:amino-acid N-acetyltransferase
MTRNDQAIIHLNASHLSDIETLLQQCALPFEDCKEELDNFYGITSGNDLIAIGALQIKGQFALLRSVAVLEGNRGMGLADRMTQHLLEVARTNGVRDIFLLTESAEHYFTRFGFEAVERNSVPAYVQSTRQFESLCPASAQAMRLIM